MIDLRERTATFRNSVFGGAGRAFFLAAALAVVGMPLGAGAGGDFNALFPSSSLDHSIGDLSHWSMQNGVLTAEASSRTTESAFLFRQERFENFILKFRARSNGAILKVLFRASILPPGALAAFGATVGGDRWGNLTFRKPAVQFPKQAKEEQGHAAPGFPDAVGEPFVRDAGDIELVPAASKMNFSPDQWADCEIDALGDHILVKINGTTTARFRVDRSFYEKALGSHLPPEMTGKNAPFYEGMIGFQLPPDTSGKVEIKDIQIQTLGDVTWSDAASSGQAANGSDGDWKASAPAFQRTTDADWAKQTHELLGMAGKTEGFRTIFDGKSLEGWTSSAIFWTAQDGVITGVPRNAFLVTDKKYSDFILKGSVRLSPEGGNSGVQVRSAVISDGMLGYQFDMGVPWWGQLYVESSMRGILAPVDDRMKRYHLIHTNDWNQFVIICKGNHLIGELNGEITFDFVDYYGDKTGSIGLQIHAGAPMTVAFKNLEINELH